MTNVTSRPASSRISSGSKREYLISTGTLSPEPASAITAQPSTRRPASARALGSTPLAPPAGADPEYGHDQRNPGQQADGQAVVDRGRSVDPGQAGVHRGGRFALDVDRQVVGQVPCR